MSGDLPEKEAMDGASKVSPLLIGADGVMDPFRPKERTLEGKTVWREVKVGILARLGKRVTKAGKQVSQLTQRRLVAVLGNMDAFRPRLWLEAMRQGLLQ